tara:strand:- start:9515 stop:10249 length:735 start_codon:yes stop_codon:yes gene_type:complete
MKFLALLFSILLSSSVYAFDHEHVQLSKILSEHMKLSGAQTLVDYQTLKKNPQELDRYLSGLSSIKKSQYDTFNSNQKLAFLINAYNAFTIKLMRDHWPVKTIKDIGGFFSSTWKKEFFTLLGQKRSLDWVEHEVIRKDFNEPRIHFAVNCASIGCPPLRQDAFSAASLDRQLEEQAKLFMNDQSKNRFENGEIKLSKIFDWYGGDFTKSGKDLIVTLNQWREDKFPLNAQIDFLSYDWAPNSY